MHGVYDSAGLRRIRANARRLVAFWYFDTIGLSPDLPFRSSIPSLHIPLSNASSAVSRPPSHDSRPGWFATPFLYDSFIHDSTPVYPDAPKYWQWATAGWASKKPYRYPLGKGRRPLCSLWNGQRLGYIDARKQIYLRLYQQAVKQTQAYAMLQDLYQQRARSLSLISTVTITEAWE
jgi:hypothetical protein